VPNGSALHLESPVSGRLLPWLILAVYRRAPLGHHGGFSAGYHCRLGGCSGGSLALWYQAFNGHRLGDGASLGFGPCQLKTFGLVSQGGYDYSPRVTVYSPSTMMASGNVASTAGASVSSWGWERTPQRLARNPLQPSPRWVHPRPRSSLWISCRVHHWLSTKYDYQTTCTTRERSSLTGSTRLLSRLGRQVC
jgi:hypothetical protein